MACSSCAAKAALMNKANEEVVVIPQDCVYTQEELLTKLEQAIASENFSQVSFIKSALNLYPKDCNMFNNYIL